MCRLLDGHHVFYVPFSEKQNHLLDLLDNRRTMHNSQNDALLVVHGSQKYARYYSDVMPPGYKYHPSPCADNHLTLFFAYLRVSLSCYMLFTNGGHERHRALMLSLVRGKLSAQRCQAPPSVPSGSPPPPGSPLEISSRCPCSPVFEQGGPSGNAPMIGLSSSSDEEGFIP
jgi:hypothetical protein